MRRQKPADIAKDTAKRLGPVVEQEARRVLTETQLAPDPSRIAAGWQHRFVTDSTRAREAMDLYEELGYEVCADSIQPQALDEGCSDCWLLTQLQFVMIYTRKKGQRERGGHAGNAEHSAGE